MIDGQLYSCFTAALAAYVAHDGHDPEALFGDGVDLAVRFGGADDMPVFAHRRRSLRTVEVLALRRVRAGDARAASEGLRAELARSGQVVVAGDTLRLPWHVGHGRASAPHWFVVEAQADGAVRVADPFAALTALGEQCPYSGWAGLDALRAPEAPTAVQAARERYVFGDADGTDGLPPGGWQWYERLPAAGPVPPAPDAPVRGAAALRALAAWLGERLGEPAAYAVAEDLWVAARGRRLLARLLARRGHRDVATALEDLADGAWGPLLRALHYNAGALDRGRAPRHLPVDLLARLADAEAAVEPRLVSAAV